MYIKPIPIGMAKAPRSLAFYMDRSNDIIDGAAYAWLLKGSEKNILIDCGEIDLERMKAHGLESGDVTTVKDAIGKEGLKPDDIDMIIATHLHTEHISGAMRFPNAKIVVQKRELVSALAPIPPLEWIYHPELIEPLFRAGRFDLVDGDVEIEPGIKLVLTPGHSAGGQSVVFEADGQTVVVAGLCCAEENFFPKEAGRDVILMGLFEDMTAAYHSMLKIKAMADVIVPLHEGKFVKMDRIP